MSEEKILLNKTVTIQKGECHESFYDIEKERPIQVVIDVESGPKVDVFMTDERGYNDYRSGLDFRTFDTFTQIGIRRFVKNATTHPNEYYLVIENNGKSGILPSFLKNELVTANIRVSVG
jgi:hypothetical protein